MKNALLVFLLPLAAAACGGSDAESNAMPEPAVVAAPAATGTVTITSPASGATVTGTSVVGQLSSTVQIVAAGTMTAGTGHHHLFLDADVSAADVPVPTVPGSIIHMGDASSSYTFTNVPPGQHRLIAVVADGVHVPLMPW
jgi:hypothetical protein